MIHSLLINFLMPKKSKIDPRIMRINRLLRKMEINLEYYRTDKSKRYYEEIKELYFQLPPELKKERKLITSRLEQILNNNKQVLSTIPKSSLLSNSWTINLKDFVQPTKEKILILLLTFLVANTPNIGIKSTITGYAFNPLFYPSFFSSPIISWKILGSAIFLTTSILYWYLLICLVIFVIKKIKK